MIASFGLEDCANRSSSWPTRSLASYAMTVVARRTALRAPGLAHQHLGLRVGSALAGRPHPIALQPVANSGQLQAVQHIVQSHLS